MRSWVERTAIQSTIARYNWSTPPPICGCVLAVAGTGERALLRFNTHTHIHAKEFDFPGMIDLEGRLLFSHTSDAHRAAAVVCALRKTSRRL